jgi:hypothetical protein
MKKKKKEVRYNLVGYMLVTDWFGNKGWKKLDIKTGEKGLQKIKQNPLQDYIEFGVRSVDYVFFEVYRSVIVHKKNCIVTVEYTDPIETIEAGEYTLTPEEEEWFEQDYDYAEIVY